MINGISPRKASAIASHQQTQGHSGGVHYSWSYPENNRHCQIERLIQFKLLNITKALKLDLKIIYLQLDS